MEGGDEGRGLTKVTAASMSMWLFRFVNSGVYGALALCSHLFITN